MTAERVSHSISSKGSTPSRLKNRAYSRPDIRTGSAMGAWLGRAGLAARVLTGRTEARANSSASFHISSDHASRHLPRGSAPKRKIVMERRQTGDVRGAGKPRGPVRRLADQYGPRLQLCQGRIH